MHEAVITGLGTVAPNGIGKKAFWNALSNGVSGIGPITKYQRNGLPCHIGGEISPHHLEEYFNELPDWLPDSNSCKFAALAAKLAIEDAGLTPDDIARRQSAIYMGVSTNDMEVMQREYKNLAETGFPRPDFILSAFPYSSTAVVAHLLKAYDNIITISTTCTAGLNSIHYGARSIMNGDADIVAVGGVDAPLAPLAVAGLCMVGMVPSDYNDQPEKACRPFDKARQGGVLAEGAGVLILEEKERALRRKAKIYGSFAGGGLTGNMSPAWIKDSMCRAMEKALTEAGLRPEDIDYISACAPGDQVLDQMETDAIKELFGPAAYNIPISSIKSIFGSPGAAAGPLQAIAAALTIENCFIPPTLNLEEAGELCDLDYVPLKGRVGRVKIVMINLRGFGGGFTSLIIRAMD